LKYQVDEMHTYQPYMHIALQNVEGVCTVMLAIVPFMPKLKKGHYVANYSIVCIQVVLINATVTLIV